MLRKCLRGGPVRSQRTVEELGKERRERGGIFSLRRIRGLLSVRGLSALPIMCRICVILSFVAKTEPRRVLTLAERSVGRSGMSFGGSLKFRNGLRRAVGAPADVQRIPVRAG